MQPSDSRGEKKTCFKLCVPCTVTCPNPGCKREYSVCGRADHLQGIYAQGQAWAAAAVPSSTVTGTGTGTQRTGPVAQDRPGAGLAVTATCPYCGHLTEIPIIYNGHEEQLACGHVTEKGNPICEETAPGP